MHSMQNMAHLDQVFMTWQGPAPQRRRFVVAQITAQNDTASFAYLQQSTDFAKAIDAGFKGYPAFPDYDQHYENGVLASLASRLPPSSRSDYPDFLRHWFMNPEDKPDLLDILAYSGGKLPRDTFGFVPVFPKHGRFDFVTELAGYHYRLKEPSTRRPEKVGDILLLGAEPDNQKDPNAVAVFLEHTNKTPQKVGYLMRGLHEQAQYWLKHGKVSANIARLNGSAERPLAYAHVWIDLP